MSSFSIEWSCGEPHLRKSHSDDGFGAFLSELSVTSLVGGLRRIFGALSYSLGRPQVLWLGIQYGVPFSDSFLINRYNIQ
jgi:hypothetical protein